MVSRINPDYLDTCLVVRRYLAPRFRDGPVDEGIPREVLLDLVDTRRERRFVEKTIKSYESQGIITVEDGRVYRGEDYTKIT